MKKDVCNVASETLGCSKIFVKSETRRDVQEMSPRLEISVWSVITIFLDAYRPWRPGGAKVSGRIYCFKPCRSIHVIRETKIQKVTGTVII